MRVILVNKTLLVSAVALAVSGNAMVSGNALAEAGVYGQIRLGLATYVPPTTAVPLGVDELDVRSGKLTFGAKGSNDLDNGQTFSYQLEMEHDAANTKQSGWDNDKSWVAIGGGWGKLTAGRASDMAGFACGGTDLLTNGTAEACSLAHSTETDNAIQYRGSVGALDFGVIFTADGTADDDDILYGAKFNGSNWSVGVQVWEDEIDGNKLDPDVGASGAAGGPLTAPSSTKTQVGATYQWGDIGLGIVVADNDQAVDSGGVSIGLYMPLGPGDLAVVISDIDDDRGVGALNEGGTGTVFTGSSFDFDYRVGMGGGAYYGLEFNSDDYTVDDRLTAYFGTTF